MKGNANLDPEFYQDSADFWAEQAKSERIGAGLTFVISATCLAATVAMVKVGEAGAAGVYGTLTGVSFMHGRSELEEAAKLQNKSDAHQREADQIAAPETPQPEQ